MNAVEKPLSTIFPKLSEKSLGILDENIVVIKFEKKKLLIDEGTIFPYLGWIEEGAIRCYTINDDGKESCHTLLLKNDYFCDFSSFFNQTSTQYYFEVLEGTVIHTITHSKLERLKMVIPELSDFNRHLLLYLNQVFERRLSILLIDNAKDRYLKLLEKFSDVMLHFPHYVIASYLGITPETLSRIRKKIFLENKSKSKQLRA